MLLAYCLLGLFAGAGEAARRLLGGVAEELLLFLAEKLATFGRWGRRGAVGSLGDGDKLSQALSCTGAGDKEATERSRRRRT